MIEIAITERVDLLIPEHALGELSRVLQEKLGFSSAEAISVTTWLRGLAVECPATPTEVAAMSGDPDDDRILAAARSAAANVLVSGDRRHLLPIGWVGELRILTPQALLAELAKS